MTFDPAEHRFGPTHWFEDLTLGQKFYINSRTQTEAMFAAFQSASGDNHPIHYDREYCKARGHRDLLAHGLQVAIQGAAGGGIFPHYIGDSLIGFLEQSSRFLKPVYWHNRVGLPPRDDARPDFLEKSLEPLARLF